MADETQEQTKAEAPKDAPKAEKTAAKSTEPKPLKGWFKAKEDCYLIDGYGYKSKDDPAFYYDGPFHHSLVKAEQPKTDE